MICCSAAALAKYYPKAEGAWYSPGPGVELEGSKYVKRFALPSAPFEAASPNRLRDLMILVYMDVTPV